MKEKEQHKLTDEQLKELRNEQSKTYLEIHNNFDRSRKNYSDSIKDIEKIKQNIKQIINK